MECIIAHKNNTHQTSRTDQRTDGLTDNKPYCSCWWVLMCVCVTQRYEWRRFSMLAALRGGDELDGRGTTRRNVASIVVLLRILYFPQNTHICTLPLTLKQQLLLTTTDAYFGVGWGSVKGCVNHGFAYVLCVCVCVCMHPISFRGYWAYTCVCVAHPYILCMCECVGIYLSIHLVNLSIHPRLHVCMYEVYLVNSRILPLQGCRAK